MKKIHEGRYEIFATKADAINKFKKLQGICREKINNENAIQFYCSKKGRITISNPPSRYVENQNSTELFAEIVEQDGRTYVVYHTAFSKANNVMKWISLAVYTLLMGGSIALSVANEENKMSFLLFPLLVLIFVVVRLLNSTKEERSSPKDSEIMIRELERRVEAVNLWDK